MLKKLRKWAKALKLEIKTIYIAYTKHKLPWYAKLIAVVVIAYALSPIDLIPDFIPVLGLLDDLILLPLGIALVRRSIPPEVWTRCKKEAMQESNKKLPKNYFAAAIFVLIWLAIVIVIVLKTIHIFN